MFILRFMFLVFSLPCVCVIGLVQSYLTCKKHVTP